MDVERYQSPPQDHRDPQKAAGAAVGAAEEGGGAREPAPALQPRRRAIIKDKVSLARRSSGRRATTASQAAPGDALGAEGEFTQLATDTQSFTAGVGVLVLLNVIVIGVEADYSCWGCSTDDRVAWYVVENVFAVAFVIEFSFRLAIEGPVGFFLGDPLDHPIGFRPVNCVDFVLISLGLVDTWVLTSIGLNTRLKLVSTLRVFRIGDFLRTVGRSRHFREIWLLMSGTGDATKAVLWTLLLLVLLIWVLGICFTVWVGQDDDSQFGFRTWDRQEYFGSVPRSCFTLFQILTGDHWSSSVVKPLSDVQPVLTVVVIIFLVVASLGTLNVIIGIIVETTLSSATAREEVKLKEIQVAQEKVTASMQSIFEEADEDKNGCIDRDELHRVMMKPHVKRRMTLLGIGKGDMTFIFDLLDDEHKGHVPIASFFRGCARSSGLAMARDLHTLTVDFNRHIKQARKLKDFTSKGNDKLAILLDEIEVLDRDIVKSDDDRRDPVLSAKRLRVRRGDIENRRCRRVAWDLGSDRDCGTEKADVRKSSKMSRRSSKPLSLVRRSLLSTKSGIDLSDMRASRRGTSSEHVITDPLPPMPPLPVTMQHALENWTMSRVQTLTQMSTLSDFRVRPSTADAVLAVSTMPPFEEGIVAKDSV